MLRRAVLTTAVATVLGSAAGALLPFAITHSFGPGQTDPYFLTIGSLLAVTSMITIVLQGTIVPFAMSWRAISAETTWRTAGLISRRMASAATGLAIIAIAVLVVAVLPHSRLSHDEKRVVVQCTLAALPLPALLARNAILCAILYSTQRFFLPASSEAFRSVVAGTVVLLPVTGKPIWAVALGLTAGEGIRALLLRRATRRSLGLRPGRLGDGRPAPLRRYWRVALMQVLSLSIVNLSPLVDKAFASGQPTGSVTVLELAEKLFYTPMMLLSSAIGLVVGTRWAGLAESGQWAELSKDHHRWQFRVGIGSTAVAVVSVICVYSAEPLLHEVLHIPHGIDFALVFSAYAVGLPFAMSGNLGARLFVSCKSTTLLPVFAAVLLAVNVLGDAVGVALYGLVGIALASSAYRVVDAGLYLSSADRVIRSAGAREDAVQMAAQHAE